MVSWPQASGTDIRLTPVFSDNQGEMYSVEIPVKNASGDNVRLPVFNIVIVVVTLLLLWLLNILINRSMFGISMRALSFDMDAAKLMGVNTNLVIAQTFAVGGACAAIAGNMVGIYNQSIDPLMGILPGLKAFIAAVVGGIGSIPGAAAGGMIMGLSEGFVKGNISQAWSSLADALAFAILIVVLLFKPSGIFGSTTKEKV
jgi:branched-chain amino acid transport system permease protein